MSNRLKVGAAAALMVVLFSAVMSACSAADDASVAGSSNEAAVETAETPETAPAPRDCTGPVADHYANSAYSEVIEFREASAEDAVAALKFATAETPFCIMHGTGIGESPANQWEFWYDASSADAPQVLLDGLIGAGFVDEGCSSTEASGSCDLWLDAADGATNFDVYWGGSGPSAEVPDAINVVASWQQKF